MRKHRIIWIRVSVNFYGSSRRGHSSYNIMTHTTLFILRRDATLSRICSPSALATERIMTPGSVSPFCVVSFDYIKCKKRAELNNAPFVAETVTLKIVRALQIVRIASNETLASSSSYFFSTSSNEPLLSTILGHFLFFLTH